jgi:ribosome biogenesis GTPase
MHINEPKCMVKNALEEGKISRIRYNNYVDMFQELKDKRRY